MTHGKKHCALTPVTESAQLARVKNYWKGAHGPPFAWQEDTEGSLRCSSLSRAPPAVVGITGMQICPSWVSLVRTRPQGQKAQGGHSPWSRAASFKATLHVTLESTPLTPHSQTTHEKGWLRGSCRMILFLYVPGLKEGAELIYYSSNEGSAL